ncbi:MAG: hypothetical protein M1831_004252 [Alyxoria varia]|nr:MAG: hypothetical protein M1831_004252 [Alyxoria varia]
MSVESPQWRPNPELENVGSEVDGHASCYPDQTQPDYDAFEWIGNYFQNNAFHPSYTSVPHDMNNAQDQQNQDYHQDNQYPPLASPSASSEPNFNDRPQLQRQNLSARSTPIPFPSTTLHGNDNGEVDPALRKLHPKRSSDEQGESESRGASPPPNKRRREGSEPPSSYPNPKNATLDQENELLLSLRDEHGLPWKEITRRFQIILGRQYQTPALQMRYTRIKQRQTPPWTEQDTAALRMAQEFYVKKRYEIIAEKMREFGATEQWSPRVCARKMQQLDPNKIKGDKRADADRQNSGMGTPDSVPPSALSMPPTPNSSSFMTPPPTSTPLALSLSQMPQSDFTFRPQASPGLMSGPSSPYPTAVSPYQAAPGSPYGGYTSCPPTSCPT